MGKRQVSSPGSDGEQVRTLGPRFESAVVFASAHHFGQVRKGNGAPYISHPLAVAALVVEYGGNEDQAIAALLHDTLEDCDVTREQLAARYGEKVAAVVVACTDTTDRPKPPWRERKESFVARLKTALPTAKLVVAADKHHNVQCILRDLARPSVGERVWDRFRAKRSEQLWYFGAVVQALRYGWQHELLDDLERLVGQLD